jgi:heme-degrading monooxygenase HmoA
MVIEVWESQEDQDAFMQSRLGPALHEAGVTAPPKRAEWSKVRSHHSPKKASAKTK